MPRGAATTERTLDSSSCTARDTDYRVFLQWLRRLARWNDNALLRAYAARNDTQDWRLQISNLHTTKITSWPPLWGCVRKSAIPLCVARYLDEHPFVSGDLPAAAFVNAVVLADQRQVELRGGDHTMGAPACCPTCYLHMAESAVLRTRLADALGERQPLVMMDSEDALLQYMLDTYHELFMHGVGATKRKTVRDAITAAVAADLGVNLAGQHALYDKLLNVIDKSQTAANNAAEGRPIPCLQRCHVPGA